MIKQLLLPLLGVAIFIILVGIFINSPGSLSFPKNIARKSPPPQITITVGQKKIQVELAKTASERELGLGSRTYMASDSGMLFIFDHKGTSPIFWMKGMLIPIDIIWIVGGKVVKIDTHVPVPAAGTPDSQLPTYSSGQPIDYVLEVNSGFSDRNEIKVNDPADLSNALK